MYESYWNLNAKPFESTNQAEFYYPSESHQGALLKLRYAIESRRGAALLSGAAGLGKTLLVHSLWKQLAEEFSPQVHMVFPDMPSDQLLAYLADELLGKRSETTPTVRDSVSQIGGYLKQNAQDGKHAVIVIDEAQSLAERGTLDTLRLLLNFDVDLKPALTLLLVGQPALLPRIDRIPELESWLGVKCILNAFTADETDAYISHRLRAAGRDEPIFEDKALEAIHYHSGGVPRQINRICDLALLIGFAEEHTSLSASHIEASLDELVSVSPE
jgi:type II secretory pathway predicted ATPase ExeA